MERIVKYNRVVRSQAMSKSPNQNGIVFTESGNVIEIEAINPKMNDKTSYLSMQIPKESLQEVIDKLKMFL